MKNVFVKTLITAMASTLVLSACGTTPGALNGALSTDDDAQFFSQLAVDGAPQFNAEGKPQHGMKGKKGQAKGNKNGVRQGAIGFLKGIELTEAQKTEVQTIMEAAKAARPEKAESADNTAREAMKEKVKAAFISDSFDADALYAEMKAAKDNGDADSRHLAQAEVQIKLWNVLTAEQQASVKTNAANFSVEDRPERPERPEMTEMSGKANPFERMGITLTAEQSTALTAAFEAEKAAKTDKPERNPSALIDLLSSGNATAEAIVALHGDKVDRNPLAKLQTLHGILTAEQRSVFAEKGLEMGGRKGQKGQGKGQNKGQRGGHKKGQ